MYNYCTKTMVFVKFSTKRILSYFRLGLSIVLEALGSDSDAPPPAPAGRPRRDLGAPAPTCVGTGAWAVIIDLYSSEMTLQSLAWLKVSPYLSKIR